jgi:hypothetical protein
MRPNAEDAAHSIAASWETAWNTHDMSLMATLFYRRRRLRQRPWQPLEGPLPGQKRACLDAQDAVSQQ